MGFLVAFCRKMYLINYTNKLQVKLNDITTQKLNLTDTISQLVSEISDIGNSDSPAVKQLESRRVELENLDRQLDMRMQKIQTQLQAANTELQSTDQAVQNGIKSTFSYTGG